MALGHVGVHECDLAATAGRLKARTMIESGSDFLQSDPRQLWTIRRLGRIASIRPRSMPSKAGRRASGSADGGAVLSRAQVDVEEPLGWRGQRHRLGDRPYGQGASGNPLAVRILASWPA